MDVHRKHLSRITSLGSVLVLVSSCLGQFLSWSVLVWVGSYLSQFLSGSVLVWVGAYGWAIKHFGVVKCTTPIDPFIRCLAEKLRLGTFRSRADQYLQTTSAMSIAGYPIQALRGWVAIFGCHPRRGSAFTPGRHPERSRASARRIEAPPAFARHSGLREAHVQNLRIRFRSSF